MHVIDLINNSFMIFFGLVILNQKDRLLFGNTCWTFQFVSPFKLCPFLTNLGFTWMYVTVCKKINKKSVAS